MALPTDQEECDPDFVHYPAKELPEFEQDSVSVKVIIGEAFGHSSPVTVRAPMLYLECRMPAGSGITLPGDTDELAAYVVDGNVKVDSQSLTSGLLAVASTGKTVRVEATIDSHVMIIGGVHMSRRHIWWNFVATSKERIEQAKRDWRENRFEGIAGETEFIPLPS